MNDEAKRVFTPKPIVSFEQNYILLKEEWVNFDEGENVVKSVNTSLKLIVFLVVSLEEHIKLTIV